MNEIEDEAGWDVEPGDEIEPLVQAVGRMLRVFRELAGMRVADLAKAMRYGEDMIRKIERGERAVELMLYSSHNINGLLQTPEYMRKLFGMRQPPLSEAVVERETTARVARQAIFEREPVPTLSFVQEQVTLERPIGGRKVLRRQLEHLLEVSQLRHVSLQVMPTDLEEHAGGSGRIQVLKFADGTAIGRSAGAFNGRPVEHPRDLRVLELRYGMIRAQALTPRESREFIEQVLGRL
jgi:transcriptional regulator with XRE-family HTH domain